METIRTLATLALLAAIGDSGAARAGQFTTLPSATSFTKTTAWSQGNEVRFTPVLQAGAGEPFVTMNPLLQGSVTDNPDQRIDPNVPSSPFAGVGSIYTYSDTDGYIGSGTPLNQRWILTAAHVVDIDGNGEVDPDFSFLFVLNNEGSYSSVLSVQKAIVHPAWNGFGFNGTVDDDLALLKLAEDLPAGVPTYDLYHNPLLVGDALKLVGYGESGNGVNGYTVGPEFAVKRTGMNVADEFEEDGDLPAGNGVSQVFYSDFDSAISPFGPDGIIGGPSLGNDVETMVGGGDSGGPAFMKVGDDYLIAGVNTFSWWTDAFPEPGKFGTGSGGIILDSYRTWIQSTIPEPGDYTVIAGLGLLGFALWRRRS